LPKKEPPALMLVPIAVLAVLAVMLGIFPGGVLSFCEQLAGSLL
jgi:formate hydrogenlyase subunit 3/multisubunit Na+/H+ antiporter MnhD subunit